MTKQHPSLCRGGACRSEAEILSERSESKGPLPLGACVLLALLLAAPPAARAADWPPISPEELALKDDPLRPGAPAITLYRELFSDHINNIDTDSVRIKILTEEGKKYANVELPFWKGRFDVQDVEARTLRPDGRVVPFTGQFFQKTVVKGRGVKLLAKTFSLPEAEVGSVIEYRYKLKWNIGWTWFWILQDQLTLRRGRFTVRPFVSPYVALRWMYHLPPGKKLEPRGQDYTVEL